LPTGLESVVAVDQTTARLRGVLNAAANRRGGWPYYQGKQSRIEPTCWALLALAESDDERAPSFSESAAPHLDWLASRQGADGLLLDVPAAPPNFTTNGLAACVLAHVAPRSRPPASPDLQPLLDGVGAAKGVAVDAPDPRQDNRLQGWPWMPDTFSWIEPTCWCVLGLKKNEPSPARSARIAEAEKLIVNRMCDGGGWNFGNASVVGQDLRPYQPTTALGLMALQDRPDLAAVTQSLAWLRRAPLREPSAVALALTAIAFQIFGVADDDVEARLAADADRAERLGNLQALAMLLYALTARRHAARALRV